MDNLDFAILRHVAHPQTFQWNVRVSYADVARAVDADEETVRTRVKRLEERGIIRDWDVAVNPAAFGRSLVRVDLPPTADDAQGKLEDALAALDGAHLLFEYYGGRFAVVLYQELGGPLDRQLALVKALAGGTPRATPMSLPPVTVPVKPSDWRLIRAVRDAPRATHGEIAAAAGVSDRTLRRRLDVLTEGRVLFLNPDVDFSRIEGSFPTSVSVVHREGSPRRAIDDTLGALPRRSFYWSEGDMTRASFAAASLAEVTALRRRIEEMGQGRVDVQVDLILRRVIVHAWMREQVERRSGAAEGT